MVDKSDEGRVENWAANLVEKLGKHEVVLSVVLKVGWMVTQKVVGKVAWMVVLMEKRLAEPKVSYAVEYLVLLKDLSTVAEMVSTLAA